MAVMDQTQTAITLRLTRRKAGLMWPLTIKQTPTAPNATIMERQGT